MVHPAAGRSNPKSKIPNVFCVIRELNLFLRSHQPPNRVHVVRRARLLCLVPMIVMPLRSA
jgi:hypothetical protein